jgi:diaminopimelate decarboxylase
MAALVDGLDVAYLGELQVALDTSTPPTAISFAGPGKTPQELVAAVASEITLNVESEHELDVIASLGRQQGKRPRVAVRVNPDFELRSSGMKMGGGALPFGVDAKRVPAMLREIGRLHLDFQGFQIYCGSQSLNEKAIAEAQNRTVDLAIHLAEHAAGPVRTLNIGVGFGIPYFPGDKRLDLDPIEKNLSILLAMVEQRLPDAAVIIELGRYLVGEAGIYVAEILDRKVSRGRVFLITNGGLHHHLATSGNFGQVIRKNFPVAIGNRIHNTERKCVSVVGPLCTPLDILADRMEMAKAEVGDLVVIFQSGAYGLSASPTGFLSHPAPLEVLV